MEGEDLSCSPADSKRNQLNPCTVSGADTWALREVYSFVDRLALKRDLSVNYLLPKAVGPSLDIHLSPFGLLTYGYIVAYIDEHGLYRDENLVTPKEREKALEINPKAITTPTTS